MGREVFFYSHRLRGTLVRVGVASKFDSGTALQHVKAPLQPIQCLRICAVQVYLIAGCGMLKQCQLFAINGFICSLGFM